MPWLRLTHDDLRDLSHRAALLAALALQGEVSFLLAQAKIALHNARLALARLECHPLARCRPLGRKCNGPQRPHARLEKKLRRSAVQRPFNTESATEPASMFAASACGAGEIMEQIEGIKVLFIAGFGPIVRETATSRRLYRESLGIGFKEKSGGYLHTETVKGAKTFARGSFPRWRNPALEEIPGRTRFPCH